MKRTSFWLTLLLALALVLAFGSTAVAAPGPNDVASVNETGYTTLEAALEAAADNDAITLLKSVTLSAGLTITDGKAVTIDLNGNDISAPDRTFTVEQGVLTLTGKGTVTSTSEESNSAAISIQGSADTADADYSVLTIGREVTLTGFSGIRIVLKDLDRSCGVKVNMNGSIVLAKIPQSAGSGIYIGSAVKDKTNFPIITLGPEASIISTGAAFYGAGYGQWNISGGSYRAPGAALAIKSGVFNISGGQFICTGANKAPVAAQSGRIDLSGAAIQVEKNGDYAGGIKLDITGGSFTSVNGYAYHEYGSQDAAPELIHISPKAMLAGNEALGDIIINDIMVFELSGGVIDHTYPSADYGLPAVTREGFEFDGWYLNGVKFAGETAQPGTAEKPNKYVAAWLQPYSDVKAGDWYFDHVKELTIGGVIKGYPDGTFRPMANVTWGEGLKMVMMAAGYAAQPALDEGHWASGFAAQALSDGLIEEEPADLNAPMDRMAIATVAARALKLSLSEEATPFVDADNGELTALFEAKIITGDFNAAGERQYRPADPITRGELCAIVCRVNSYGK